MKTPTAEVTIYRNEAEYRVRWAMAWSVALFCAAMSRHAAEMRRAGEAFTRFGEALRAARKAARRKGNAR